MSGFQGSSGVGILRRVLEAYGLGYWRRLGFRGRVSSRFGRGRRAVRVIQAQAE